MHVFLALCPLLGADITKTVPPTPASVMTHDGWMVGSLNYKPEENLSPSSCPGQRILSQQQAEKQRQDTRLPMGKIQLSWSEDFITTAGRETETRHTVSKGKDSVLENKHQISASCKICFQTSLIMCIIITTN